MISFNDWCDLVVANVGTHRMSILSARPKDLPFAQEVVAAVVPDHYASEEHIAGILQRLAIIAAATFIREKLLISKSIRSGDHGEILATEYIDEETSYDAPISYTQ